MQDFFPSKIFHSYSADSTGDDIYYDAHESQDELLINAIVETNTDYEVKKSQMKESVHSLLNRSGSRIASCCSSSTATLFSEKRQECITKSEKVKFPEYLLFSCCVNETQTSVLGLLLKLLRKAFKFCR